MSRSQICSWQTHGRLVRIHRSVYAVGPPRDDLTARQWAAILYAGPGASLTGMSGAHLRGLIDRPPEQIVVATPQTKRRSLDGVRVLVARQPERELHQGIPVAPIPALMLQLAADADLLLVRRALANLDFRRALDLPALRAVCGRGRPGSAILQRAMAHHLPQLAHTRSPLEDAFLILLDTHHLPLPRVNVRVHGVLVDAFWRELGLVVELDGDGNHGTAAQRRRDVGSSERLRGHGLTVLRFTHPDVIHRPARTLAVLAAHGVRR